MPKPALARSGSAVVPRGNEARVHAARCALAALAVACSTPGIAAPRGEIAGSPAAAPPADGAGTASLARVEARRIQVESGAIEPTGREALALRRAGVRAVVPGTTGAAAQISFVYRGPSREVSALASGELRRQIGMKLRAQDTCNVVYVMWHIAPSTGIHVQVKSNPGQRTHRECLDHGYRSVKPDLQRDVPPLRVGERHSLAASISGRELRVLADGARVWEGVLPDETFAFDGPAGIRSDNGEFDVELWAAVERRAE